MDFKLVQVHSCWSSGQEQAGTMRGRQELRQGPGLGPQKGWSVASSQQCVRWVPLSAFCS